MSIKVMTWVWDHSTAAGIDRLVLLAIADAASGDDGTNAYPSVATLAKKAGVVERTVQRSIKALCELGELTVQPGAGRKGSNLYTIVMTGSHPDTESPRQPDTRHTVTTPVNQSPRGVSQSKNPRHVVTQSVIDPSGTRGTPRRRRCNQNHPAGQPCGPCRQDRLDDETAATAADVERRAAIHRNDTGMADFNADLSPPRDKAAFKAARQLLAQTGAIA